MDARLRLKQHLAALSRVEKILLVLGVVVGAMGLLLLYFKNPSSDSIFPPCPTESLMGFYCPGCGTLRALHALLHGEFLEALSQNVLAVLVIPVLVLLVIFPERFRSPVWPLSLLVVFILYAILRNTETFCFLAPH